MSTRRRIEYNPILQKGKHILGSSQPQSSSLVVLSGKGLAAKVLGGSIAALPDLGGNMTAAGGSMLT